MIDPLVILTGIIAVLFATVGIRAVHWAWCRLTPPRLPKLLFGSVLVPLALVGACHLAFDRPFETPGITALREKGAGYQWRAFTLLPETPAVNLCTKLPEVTVHIVGDREVIRQLYPEKDPIALMQYSYKKGRFDIWVIGRQTEHGILVDQQSLGHELMHVLSLITGGELLDPDELKDMGL